MSKQFNPKVIRDLRKALGNANRNHLEVAYNEVKLEQEGTLDKRLSDIEDTLLILANTIKDYDNNHMNHIRSDIKQLYKMSRDMTRATGEIRNAR